MTQDGRLLIEQMRKVLLEAQNLMTLASRSKRPFGGSFRFSAITTLGPYYFPHILHGLRARYADLSLVLGEGKTEDLVTALLSGALDAVLIAAPVADPGLANVPLFREPFVMACPSDHAAASRPGVGWSGLAPHERLLLEEGHCLRDQAIAACAEFEPSARHTTSLETLKYMVAAGEGCTLIPALAVAPTLGLEYVPLPHEQYGRTIVLAWRLRDPRGDEFRALAGHLQDSRPEGVDAPSTR